MTAVVGELSVNTMEHPPARLQQGDPVAHEGSDSTGVLAATGRVVRRLFEVQHRGREETSLVPRIALRHP